MVRPDRDALSGVVEVDETYIGGAKPGKRGRGAAGKSLVAVAIELRGRKLGRVRLRRIVDASARIDFICPRLRRNRQCCAD